MAGQALRVGVVGATGLVGENIMRMLEARAFPVLSLTPIASARSAGKMLSFHDVPCPVQAVDAVDFKQLDLCFFSAGGSVSKQWVPKALEAGCRVIDNTSCFRYDDAVPLVIPEVNSALLKTTASRLVANPNCSTIQMLVALNPIHQAVGIRRINVATYQSVSGAGASGVDALARQTVSMLQDQEPLVSVFPKQMAFNAVPQIDDFELNGYTREEMKMVWETQKIWGDATIKVNPTAVRIPVFYGHGEAVHVELASALGVRAAHDLLRKAPGVVVLEGEDYPTSITHADGQDPVFVGRLRQDISSERGLNMWVVADNVRKGAALNAVQIAEAWAIPQDKGNANPGFA
jgi:aspartate-semialdehyde dehydrogenase